MKQLNTTLYDILDAQTSEYASYKKVTTFRDGTSMSDAKVDGVIYRKRGEEYFKRVVQGPLNVQWFGAKGDGVTDDTGAIQKALDGLPAMGGELFFPKGDSFYKVTAPLIINKHFVTLSGDGKSVIIKNTGAGKLLEISKDYCTIKSISLHGTGGAFGVGASGTHGIHFNGGRHFTLEDVSIRNHGGHGLYCTGGVWTGGINNCEIIGNLLDGVNSISPDGTTFNQNGNALSFYKTAISLNGGNGLNWKASALNVTGCTLEANKGAGFLIDCTGLTNSAYGVAFKGNYTENNEAGELRFKVITGTTITGLVIDGNYFYSNRTTVTSIIKFEGPAATVQGVYIGTNSYVLEGTLNKIVDGGSTLQNNCFVEDVYNRGNAAFYPGMGTARKSSDTLTKAEEQTITGIKTFNEEVRLGNAKKLRAFLNDGTTLRDAFYMSVANVPTYKTAGNGLEIRSSFSDTLLARFTDGGTMSLSGLTASKPVFTNASKELTNTGAVTGLTKFVTADNTLTLADFGTSGELTVYADATNTPLILTLPATATAVGYVLNVIKADTTSNTVTVKANGAEVINSSNTDLLLKQYDAQVYQFRSFQVYKLLPAQTPPAKTGTAVTFIGNGDYGDPTPLTTFTLSTTGGIRGSVVTLYVTGYSARPTPLNAAAYKIATEPATYDPAKELMIMLRYVSATKIICTITQY